MKDSEEADSVSTEVKLQVSSMTLTLNKLMYPLATAKITGLATHITLKDGNFAAEGKLACVSLMDMSPHGTLYMEK